MEDGGDSSHLCMYVYMLLRSNLCLCVGVCMCMYVYILLLYARMIKALALVYKFRTDLKGRIMLKPCLEV